ncbi:MAG TPA: GNAT family N-acetyltransferase [Baekduia sp.]|nr:GNAT family N-acetyltransferase [Baekduia sp.]
MKVSADELRERQSRSQRAFYRIAAPASRGGQIFVLDRAVLAAVVPAMPQRSLPNAVTYTDPSAIEPVLDELGTIYSSAGVQAWTVWVRPGDDDLAFALERAGHKLDGTPELMGAVIGDCDLTPQSEMKVSEGTWEDVALCNNAAFGAPRGAFEALVMGLGDQARRHVVHDAAGAPQGCVVSAHIKGDCYFTFVATIPEARGRGIASHLMRAALRAGLEDGCVTTTLEASKLGHGTYARLGYRSLGALRMYEKRE